MSGPTLTTDASEQAFAPGGWFNADEAAAAAERVFNHDPGLPFPDAKEPKDEAAAAAAVRRLGQLFAGLPASIRQALRGAESNAGHLSDDRLQGLAELIQNADDVGATRVTFTVESGPTGSAIFCSHNGSPLRLRDVMGLATPWLSLKSNDPRSLGRFGIGLMTLRSLSDSLDVHCDHFHLTLESQRLTPLDNSRAFPLGVGGDGTTVFRIPIGGEAVRQDEIASWLDSWGDAGLIFLNSVQSVEVLDHDGIPIATSTLSRGEPMHHTGADGIMTSWEVQASDGRVWSVYSQDAPTPAHLRRSLKAQSTTTPVAIAFPIGHHDSGHLHVGLPVRPIGLPFRVSAQFDPLANRRDVADNDWNIGLVSPISQLWLDASLNIFNHSPHVGWACVPLVDELDNDARTRGRLRDALDDHLMQSARSTLADIVTFDVPNHGRLGMDDLAVEHPDLTPILEPEDTAKLAERMAALPLAVRDSEELWRTVLNDLGQAGARTPEAVEVPDAIPLLENCDRTVGFISDLTATAIVHDLDWELSDVPCLVLDDESLMSPNDVKGTIALVNETAAPLWNILQMGLRLHSNYCSRNGWPQIEKWLVENGHFLRTPTSEEALFRLANAGSNGGELPEPLTDAQAEALRDALEAVDESDRVRLGQGIGRAIRIDAIQYGAKGQRISVHSRPCDAYIIEREAGTWHTAAGKTPGLTWLHRRYSTDLRAERGRAGIGSQRLFRLLGAETAPRLTPHTKAQKRFAHGPWGVPQDLVGLPNRREALREKGATFTTEDFVSPDLDAVLRSIAGEKSVTQRRLRANAVLSTLAKAWERLNPYATVAAVLDYNFWQDRGVVSACWLFSAASVAWLSNAKGTASHPSKLKLRSPGNVAIHGTNPADYLHREHDNPAWHIVLESLGVYGDPRARELIRALEDVRAVHNDDPIAAENAAAPLYQALAHQIPSGSVVERSMDDLTKSKATEAFGRGQGLIATKLGWRRPSSVLSGPPVFGSRRAFVPAVSGTDRLWRLIGIRAPSFNDARNVIRELAKVAVLNTDQKLVMLESLRIMSRGIGDGPNHRRINLRRMPVWTNQGWITQRPVLAVLNQQLAEALEDTAAVWKPGGDVRQFDALIEPLALTRLDASEVRVVASDKSVESEWATEVFTRAVRNLQSDLSMNDVEAEQTLEMSWDELVGYEVRVLPALTLKVNHHRFKGKRPLRVGAWIDQPQRTLYLEDTDEAGRVATGGNALASLFGVEARRIAQAWMAAWSDGVDGYHAEAVSLASRRAADEAAKREAANENRLHELRNQANVKRAGARGAAQKTADPGISRPVNPARSPLPARILVDPDTLSITDPQGIMQDRELSSDTDAARRADSDSPLRSPNRDRPKRPSTGRGPTNYTPEERESVGMALVRQVLGTQESGIVDIRNQHNVGADAVDDLQRFFELKVFQGDIPNLVRLTDSEVQRALDTENFFLVLVGHVEQGTDHPEVRIITDPLGQLLVEPTGTIQLSGIHKAQSLVYSFSPVDESVNASSPPQPPG